MPCTFSRPEQFQPNNFPFNFNPLWTPGYGYSSPPPSGFRIENGRVLSPLSSSQSSQEQGWPSFRNPMPVSYDAGMATNGAWNAHVQQHVMGQPGMNESRSFFPFGSGPIGGSFGTGYGKPSANYYYPVYAPGMMPPVQSAPQYPSWQPTAFNTGPPGYYFIFPSYAGFNQPAPPNQMYYEHNQGAESGFVDDANYVMPEFVEFHPPTEGQHLQSQLQEESNATSAVSPQWIANARKLAQERKGPKQTCYFCKTNKEMKKFYQSHSLRDSEGQITCPVLQKYICPICGATGANAHTVGHCPQNPNGVVKKAGRKLNSGRPKRNSRGIIGQYHYDPLD